MDLDEILLTAEEAMEKAVQYVKSELRGVRTGRASTGLVDYVKVDYYGASTDLRQLAAVTVPEPTQLLIKPFDSGVVAEVAKAIQAAGLGLNPVNEGKQIRLNLPALSGDRRRQLVASVKQMGEQGKVTMRNARRDANKQVDQALKDKEQHISEDQAEDTKNEVQELLKKYESSLTELIDAKVKEVEEI